MRLYTRIGRGTGVSMGPLGTLVAVVALPLAAAIWLLAKGLAALLTVFGVTVGGASGQRTARKLRTATGAFSVLAFLSFPWLLGTAVIACLVSLFVYAGLAIYTAQAPEQ